MYVLLAGIAHYTKIGRGGEKRGKQRGGKGGGGEKKKKKKRGGGGGGKKREGDSLERLAWLPLAQG